VNVGQLVASGEPSRSRHLEVLILASLALLGALLLQVREPDQVSVLGISALTLPPLCQSQALLGVPCPGCGLTRSFVHYAHGDWRAGWANHRIGGLLLLVTLAQIPYRICALWGPRRLLINSFIRRATSYALLALLLGNWLWNLISS
jgi:hypothetical protein